MADKTILLRMRAIISLLLLYIPAVLNAQNSASKLLSLAEAGKADSVRQVLQGLMQKNPLHPEYMFVDAVLTDSGQQAFVKFTLIADKYPDSKYADAACYRMHQYYYALGAYRKADSMATVLKKRYPQSPYIAYSMSMADTSSPAKVKQVAEKKVPPVGNWIVQAGAFVKKENAEILRKQLLQGGLTFVINEKQAAGTTLFVVTTATENEENAKTIAVKLESNYKIKARVTKNDTEKQ